jgi:hypothetical protein
MNVINKLTFAYELSLVDDKMNGYKNNDFNLISMLESKWVLMIYSKSIPLRIGYNKATNKNYVYVCMSISDQMTEEVIKSLDSICSEIIKKQDLNILFPTIKKKFKIIKDATTIPYLDSEKPRDYILTRALTNNEDDLKLYTKFSKSLLMNLHLKFLCAIKKLGIDKNKDYTFSQLPIHNIDLETETLLIHKGVLESYSVFRAANQLLVDNTDDTREYEIAKLMMLDLSFGKFVLNTFSGFVGKEDVDPVKVESAMGSIVKKAKSTIKKNKVPEQYFDALVADLKALY